MWSQTGTCPRPASCGASRRRSRPLCRAAASACRRTRPPRRNTSPTAARFVPRLWPSRRSLAYGPRPRVIPLLQRVPAPRGPPGRSNEAPQNRACPRTCGRIGGIGIWRSRHPPPSEASASASCIPRGSSPYNRRTCTTFRVGRVSRCLREAPSPGPRPAKTPP